MGAVVELVVLLRINIVENLEDFGVLFGGAPGFADFFETGIREVGRLVLGGVGVHLLLDLVHLLAELVVLLVEDPQPKRFCFVVLLDVGEALVPRTGVVYVLRILLVLVLLDK